MSLPKTIRVPSLPSPPAEPEAEPSWPLPVLDTDFPTALPDQSLDMQAFTNFIGLTPPASSPDYDFSWLPPPLEPEESLPLESGEGWLSSYSGETLGPQAHISSLFGTPGIDIDLFAAPFYFGNLPSSFTFDPNLPSLPIWPNDDAPLPEYIPASQPYTESVELAPEYPLLYPPTLCTPFLPPIPPYPPIYSDDTNLPPSRKRAAPVHNEDGDGDDEPAARQPAKRRKLNRPELRIVTSSAELDAWTAAQQQQPEQLAEPPQLPLTLSPALITDPTLTLPALEPDLPTAMPPLAIPDDLIPTFDANSYAYACCTDGSCPACTAWLALNPSLSVLSGETWVPTPELTGSPYLPYDSDPAESLDDWLRCLPQWPPSLPFKL